MNVWDIPEPRLTPEEREDDNEHCAACGYAIYPDENRYKCDYEWICEDCFVGKFDVLTPPEIADMIGVEYERVGF